MYLSFLAEIRHELQVFTSLKPESDSNDDAGFS
jgi:hypothetical protein